MKPIITVIMSVYNADEYLEYTIASIMNQTFKDFEAIIINDASNDNTKLILSKIKDPRFIIINNTVNKGLTVNLNTAINMARGEYIIRIDSDDICLEERFQKQLDYLRNHPKVDVLGTNAYLIDMHNSIVGVTDEETDLRRIKTKTMFLNPFIHPTIMAKTDVLKNYFYNESYRTCQDFELWTRIQKKCCFANMCTPLIFYRLNAKGATRSARNKILDRIELLVPIVSQSINQHGLDVSEDTLKKIIALALQAKCYDKEDVYKAYSIVRDADIDREMAFSCVRYFGLNLIQKKEYRLFLIGMTRLLRYYCRIIGVRIGSFYVARKLRVAIVNHEELAISTLRKG